MSQNLPTNGFKWMTNLTKDKLMEILEKTNHSMSNRGKKGYVFEVDLEYPKKLWETHNDYPLRRQRQMCIRDRVSHPFESICWKIL